MRRLTVYLTAVFSLLSVAAFAQVNPDLFKTLSAVAGMRDRFPIEKAYLQLDKPYYSVGDTLHFKAYLMNGDFLRPSLRSGLMYIELDDAADKMVKQFSIPVASGISWGDVVLDEKEIPQGSYTLRAYTSWMLNFGEDYIFKKTIFISPLSTNLTLVNAAFKLEDSGTSDKVTANLLFTNINGEPLRLKDMWLSLGTTYRWLFNNKLNTGMDGRAQLNFSLADKTSLKNLFMKTRQLDANADTTVLIIPITINRPENTDVQFMPEGGNMVAGLPIKIGFKAISEDGKGVTVNGKILNSKQQVITSFSTVHKGMGSFELTPQTGESYTAKVSLSNTTLNFKLPAVNAKGTILSVASKGTDSLQVTLNASADVLGNPVNYYLVGQTRGMVCYSALINFKGSAITKTIGKDLFPSGIAHFTLLSAANQSLNERIVYIDHKDNLQIIVTADKPTYTPRDSVAIAISVKDKDGKPAHGTFSLAVTDDHQVRADSLDNNIISNLFLSTDLRGNIEEPAYYFTKPTLKKGVELDNLMLTQGWVGYDWKEIFNTTVHQPEYHAELGFAVQGKLINIFNKPIKQTTVTLFQKTPFLVLETKTNDEGRFTFKDKTMFSTDTSSYMIEAKKKNGEDKSFNIEVIMDDFTLPEFKESNQRLTPWYYNTDTTLLTNAGIKIAQLKAEEGMIGGGHMLKEVVIKEQKIVLDSHNLNGEGQSDFALTKKDMEKQRSRTLYEVLRDRFSDFHAALVKYGNSQYFLGQQRVALVIDGIVISKFRMPVDQFMDALKATDIKGIEVMSSAQYTMAYFPPPSRFNPDVAFLEITTYSGNGAFLNKTPGRNMYKPIAMSLPKQFYSPKYTASNKTTRLGTDLRSTIYWSPQVVTDLQGNATVSFYTADKPSDYTLTLEGTDLKGAFGYSRQKIKVTANPTIIK